MESKTMDGDEFFYHTATGPIERPLSALDSQEGGNHYQKLGNYQPWIVLSKWMNDDELKGAMKKEVIAYLAREKDKGGREDIKKAMHTLQIYLELTQHLEKKDEGLLKPFRYPNPK